MGNNNLLYRDKPIFGLDIGFSHIKVMQISRIGKKHTVTGYGTVVFDPNAITKGIIKEPEIIAKAALSLFKNKLIGTITTNRVALTIPATRTFNRAVQLPKLDHKELDEAVKLEAGQYIPLPINELYMDYEIISETKDIINLLVVASPRELVDSYIDLAKLLGLEVASIETTIGSSSRLFLQAEENEVATVLIDFGSVSSDITIYDKTLAVTSTIPTGGDNITEIIAKKLGVSSQEANLIKSKYGLGISKKQKEITEALDLHLEQLVREIRRMIRYNEERSGTQRKIGQIVTMGGGANMPGLSEYLTNALRLPVRMCNPWEYLGFGHLQPPNNTEKSMYITVAGSALIEPKEIF